MCLLAVGELSVESCRQSPLWPRAGAPYSWLRRRASTTALDPFACPLAFAFQPSPCLPVMSLSASWTRIKPSVALDRSSLAVAIVGDAAFVFGGELKPRTPLDADVHIISLKGASRRSSRALWPRMDLSRWADGPLPLPGRWQGRDCQPPGRRDRRQLAISSSWRRLDRCRRQCTPRSLRPKLDKLKLTFLPLALPLGRPGRQGDDALVWRALAV